MPLHAEQSLILAHPVAIVFYPNVGFSPISELDLNFGRPCINAVLNQFLEHGNRSFDNLARCDLIRNLISKNSDLWHPHIP